MLTTAAPTAAPSAFDIAGPLDRALERIAASAGDRDRIALPPFPAHALGPLIAAGALASNAIAGPARPPAAGELSLVRRIAAADGSVARIVDGHLNAVERLAVQAPPVLRDRELAAVRAGRLLAGVWGADPRPSEGRPASVSPSGDGLILTGVKTFCSGAGGLHRAVVLARPPDADGPPVAVWVDLTASGTVEVDELWYRGSGLRASASHRVCFHRAPVLATLGSLTAEPWFARDALRTAASWAGMADAALDAALDELADRPARGPLEELAAGSLLARQATLDAWLARAAAAMDAADPELPALALRGRAGIARAAREILELAAAACGSHPFARGGRLDRARRDLELFLLQHRLEPALARDGSRALAERTR